MAINYKGPISDLDVQKNFVAGWLISTSERNVGTGYSYSVATEIDLDQVLRPAVSGSWRFLDVLEERYARGEIKRYEYLEKRRDLGR